MAAITKKGLCVCVNDFFRINVITPFCRTPKLVDCRKNRFSYCVFSSYTLCSNRKISSTRNCGTGTLALRKNNVTFGPEINVKASHHLAARASTIDGLLRLPYVCVRYKTGKRKKGKADSVEDDLELEDRSDDEDKSKSEFDDEEEEEDDDTEAPKDYKDVIISVTSLRADVILKGGLGMSRTKIEDQFYQGNLYNNGRKILKKSSQVEIGDELDLVIGPHADNENMLDVQRVIVKSLKEEKTKRGNSTVKVRRWKNLTVENYL